MLWNYENCFILFKCTDRHSYHSLSILWKQQVDLLIFRLSKIQQKNGIVSAYIDVCKSLATSIYNQYIQFIESISPECTSKDACCGIDCHSNEQNSSFNSCSTFLLLTLLFFYWQNPDLYKCTVQILELFNCVSHWD